MKWEVRGADARTGKDRVSLIEAPSQAAAERLAGMGGLLIETVTCVDLPQALVPEDEATMWSPPVQYASRPAPKRRSSSGIPIAPVLITAILCCCGFVLFWFLRSRESFTVTNQSLGPPPIGSRTTATPSSSSPSGILSSVLPASTGDIVGAAWLTRNNGASDMQLGLHVSLLRKDCSTAAVLKAVALTTKSWRDHAAEERQRAAEARKRDKQYESPYFVSRYDSGAIYEESAKESDRGAEKSDAYAARLLPGTQMNVLEAFRLLKGISRYEMADFSPVETNATIAKSTTGSDGKYSISQVPAGTYYIRATNGSRSFFTEWLVPVQVTANTTAKVDLYNENAETIQNH